LAELTLRETERNGRRRRNMETENKRKRKKSLKADGKMTRKGKVNIQR